MLCFIWQGSTQLSLYCFSLEQLHWKLVNSQNISTKNENYETADLKNRCSIQLIFKIFIRNTEDWERCGQVCRLLMWSLYTQSGDCPPFTLDPLQILGAIYFPQIVFQYWIPGLPSSPFHSHHLCMHKTSESMYLLSRCFNFVSSVYEQFNSHFFSFSNLLYL